MTKIMNEHPDTLTVAAVYDVFTECGDAVGNDKTYLNKEQNASEKEAEDLRPAPAEDADQTICDRQTKKSSARRDQQGLVTILTHWFAALEVASSWQVVGGLKLRPVVAANVL